MNRRFPIESPITRRSFLAGASAIAATAALPKGAFGRSADKPNSVFNGVRIGCITYSYRGEINSAEDTLKALVEDGLSEVELMDGPILSYAGIERGKAPSPDKVDAQLAKVAELRKMYNDAGVNIHIHKIPFGKSDEEIDFNFRIAQALGASAITLERSEPMAKRLAPFAEKYKVRIGFHNHTDNYPMLEKNDPILDISPMIGFNLDIGHYYAGTKGKSPIPVLEKYHDRITSLHLKDRTTDGKNLPWGEGGTPIKEVLQLMKKEKWTFPGDIEVEYAIPKGSTAVAEVARCVRYCREALA
ncbi:MAG: sugar phosphate isomerase/epimerase [Isosphaeraceae bacterium]